MRFRSLLYVPASSERFIAKAHTRNADAIILDLEDAVSPEHKDVARDNLAASIKTVGQAGAQVFVRINAKIKTALRDAKAAHLGGAFGLYVTKANVEKLAEIDLYLTELEQFHQREPLKLVALIENAGGVLNAPHMAKMKRMLALSVGSEDLATSMGATPTPQFLKFPKQFIHFAAKAENLLSFGLFQTVAHYSDIDAISAAAIEANNFGFDGASCVHPSAVGILNTAFMPSPEQIEWARKVLAEAERTTSGAFVVEGEMVDAPVVKRARDILDDAKY